MAPRLPHPHLTCTDTVCNAQHCWSHVHAESVFFLFFLIQRQFEPIRADLNQFWQKRASKRPDSGQNERWNGPIPTKMDAKMGCHHVVGLHFFCFMWPCVCVCVWEREREREREREIRTIHMHLLVNVANCDKKSKGESCRLWIDFWIGVLVQEIRTWKVKKIEKIWTYEK